MLKRDGSYEIKSKSGNQFLYVCVMITSYFFGAVESARKYERTIRHPLFPSNAFLKTIPEFPFGIGFPADELHALILGVFGDHLMFAAIHL